MPTKVRLLSEAISEFVRDGQTLAMEGFTHLIPFAAAHEIIRQGRRNLTLVRMTPDIIYDQMIAVGCCRKLIFGWAGNPGIGSLHAFRRAVEHQHPRPIELEEYSHFGLAMRFHAAAAGLPYMPLRSFARSDLPSVNPNIRQVVCPFTGQSLYAVPALHPDVTILHAQRADESGNVQVWGITGVQREAALAAKCVIVTVEEIVPSHVIRSDPNRTLLPASAVTTICEVPMGAHPSYVQGYYGRDTEFYRAWDTISRDVEQLSAWIREWITKMPDRGAYVDHLSDGVLASLEQEDAFAEPINYGRYR